MEKKKIIQVSEQTHRQITAYKAMYGLKTIDEAINRLLQVQKGANNG